MTPEERAMNIGYCTCHNASDSMAGKHDEYCMFTRIAAAIRAAIVETLRGYAIGFRNAAFVVRRDKGPELRAVAFEDAASTCDMNADRIEKEGA